MTVYITIRDAQLKYNPSYDVQTSVQSSTAELETQILPSSKNPKFYVSFISSIRQRRLKFTVNDKKSQTRSNALGEGVLDFGYFQFKPLEQVEYPLYLKKDGSNAGRLNLSIFYSNQKTFLGPIQFYDLGSLETEMDMRRYYLINRESGGERERIKFYKGPCKNKNMFSCCDQSVNSEEFEVLQYHYRQKK